MRRRGFLKKLPIAAGSSFMLNNLPLNALAKSGPLHRLAASSNNDKVLILIQLHGGNDGLNTVTDNFDTGFPVFTSGTWTHLNGAASGSDLARTGLICPQYLPAALPLNITKAFSHIFIRIYNIVTLYINNINCSVKALQY